MVRKFYIINGNGERFDLNTRHALLHNPKFSLELSNEYNEYTVSRRANKQSVSNGEFTGQVAFKTYKNNQTNEIVSAYTQRQSFIKHMTKTPLHLEYWNDNGVWLKDIKFKKYELDEMKYVNGLDNEISFEELTPFYRYVTSEDFEPLDVGVHGKTFWVDNNGTNGGYYTYAYTFGRSSIQTSDNDIIYTDTSDTLLDNKFVGQIELILQPTSSKVTLSNSVSGITVSEDGFNLPSTMNLSNYTMKYTTFDESVNAVLVSSLGGSEISAYQYQDMTKSNYVNFKIGETNHLIITGANIVSWRIREVHNAV